MKESEETKCLNAPRVTPVDIEDNIRAEIYFTGDQAVAVSQCIRSEYVEGEHVMAPLSLLTFCVLVLRNGFTVTGESACASPQNFDLDMGRKIARQNAIAKVWPLMGYELRTKINKKE